MARYIHIKIENPCHQKWEEMQPTSSGSFCQSCKKEVTDFSGMTDSQLLAYFKKPLKGVCGRFYADQLESPLEIPVKRIPWLRYFFQVTLPAFLFTYKASAQRLMKKPVAAIVMTEKKTGQPLSLVTNILVTGRIIGSDGKAIPYASVIIKGTNEGTAADSEGCFTIQLKDGKRFLEVSAVGYEKKLVSINVPLAESDREITLQENINIGSVTIVANMRNYRLGAMTGAVVVVTRGWGSSKKNNVQMEDSINIFPNPAKRNSEVTIHWKKPVRKDQQVILYSIAGVKLSEQKIFVTGPQSDAQVNLNISSAGYYIVHVIDSKTHKTFSAKLLVE